MKTILTLFGSLSIAAVLPLAAQVTEKETTTDTQTNPDGSVTQTETTKTTTFTPAARKQVVTYFERYKTDPYGLPPAWVSTVKVKELPTHWHTDTMQPGFVFPKAERTYLVAPPADMVKVLPPAPTGVKYYVAGRQVVAVDPQFTVVDSITIPTISYSGKKLNIDEDDVEDLKDAREDGDDVEIEIDDDGDVDIDD